MSPLRQGVLYAAALALSKALAFALLPLSASCLTPADFGRLEVLTAFSDIAGIVLGLGLVEVLYRHADRARPVDPVAAELSGLALLASLAAMPALAAGSAWLAAGLGADPIEMLLIGVAVAVEPALAVPLARLRMRDRADRFAALVAGRAVLQSASAAAALLAGFGVVGVLAAGAAAALVTTAGALGLQWRGDGIRIRPSAWPVFFGYGLPLVLAGMASFVLGAVDRWVLAASVPLSAVGIYGIAVKVAMIAAALTLPFEQWWYPRRLALAARPDGGIAAERGIAIGLVLAVLAGVVTATGGPVAAKLLLPPAYHGAGALVPWIVAGLALQAAGSLLNVGAYARSSGIGPMLVAWASAGVAAAGYLMLVPSFGVAGAIAATLLAQAWRLGHFVRLSQRALPLPLRLPAYGGLALTAAAAVALARLPEAIPVQVAAGAAAVAAVAAAAVALGMLPSPLRAIGEGRAHA